MPILICVIFGLIAGSFLNVCILRMPYKESIAFPSSHCLSCRTPLRWWHNIPLISFVILKGKCFFCHSKISLQYPIIEAVTGIFFAALCLRFGVSGVTLAYFIFTAALILQAGIDWKHEIIPDVITLPGMALGFIFSIVFPELHGQTNRWVAALQSGLGILIGGGSLYLIGTLAEKMMKKEAMGGGDVKLLAMIGAFLGFAGIVCTLFLASFLGALLGMYLRWKKGRERIPFGPFLGGAAVIYVFFGKWIVDWYFNLLNVGLY